MTRYDADLSDSDPGAALRVTMNASVSGIRLPAGLLDRAVSRDRRRQARNRLTGAVGAVAAVAAVAAVIAAVPGGRPALKQQTAGPQAQTAAYVLNRAAAAQVNAYHMISVDRETGAGPATFYTDVATHQQRTVQPDFQDATGIVGGVTRETQVEYKHHVYSTFTPSDDRHGGAMTDPSAFLPGQTNQAQAPAVAFHQALKAGLVTVVGHRSLNGRDTILLRISNAYSQKSGANVKAGAHSQSVLIWINATTYLIVQETHPQLYRHGLPPVVDHVTWLSPTPGNLALLTVTPPAGFTKIPLSELAKYLRSLS